MQKIVRFFPDTDMRNGHDGLSRLAKEHKVNVFSLGKGEYALFMNRKLTHCKLFAAGNIIAHLRMPDSKRIDPSAIALIPKFFDGAKIHYDGALTEALKKRFKVQDL